MVGNSWVAAQLAASREGISVMESVSYINEVDSNYNIELDK
jgi:hypothetical protein